MNTATWEDNRAVMAADLSDAQHTTSGALKRRDDAAKQLRSQADHVPLMEQALAETRDLVSAANLRKLERDIARERASQRRFDAQTAAYRNSRDAWRDRIWWR